MRRFLLCLGLASLTGCSGSGGGDGQPKDDKPDASGWVRAPGGVGFSLDQYRGKNPVLIISTRSTEDHSYQFFWKNWPRWEAEAKKQQLVMIELIGDASGRIIGGDTLTRDQARDLYDNYAPSPNVTTVIVVGRDGKVKYRGSADPQKAMATLP